LDFLSQEKAMLLHNSFPLLPAGESKPHLCLEEQNRQFYGFDFIANIDNVSWGFSTKELMA
jgi:hypothetical protein